MQPRKLNLGCGHQVPNGWINVDFALGARLAKLPLFRRLNRKLRLFNVDWDGGIVLADLTKPFPWPSDSIDVVYSSHTLEHLDRTQGRVFLTECCRVLKPNGIARILVPDLAGIVAQYVRGELAADRFVEALGVVGDDARDGPLKRRLAFLVRHPHRCMYDPPTLIRIMAEVGLDARARAAHDSDISDIEAIELLSRTPGSVIVEGRKRG